MNLAMIPMINYFSTGVWSVSGLMYSGLGRIEKQTPWRMYVDVEVEDE